MQPTHGSELGAWVEDAGNDHRLNDVAIARAATLQGCVKAEAAQAPEGRGDVPVGAAAGDLEGPFWVSAERGALEKGAEGFDPRIRPI